MSNNAGQVAAAMSCGLVLMLVVVLAAFAIMGFVSSEATENETHPIAQIVTDAASGNILLPLLLVISVVVCLILFVSTSFQAFG